MEKEKLRKAFVKLPGRERIVEKPALINYPVKMEEINSVSHMRDIIFDIENDFATCMNKIKGWLYLENKDFNVSELYFYVEISKSDSNRGLVIPLNYDRMQNSMNELKDNKLKFESYMPAEVIHNQKYIKKAGLLLKSDNQCGRIEIY